MGKAKRRPNWTPLDSAELPFSSWGETRTPDPGIMSAFARPDCEKLRGEEAISVALNGSEWNRFAYLIDYRLTESRTDI